MHDDDGREGLEVSIALYPPAARLFPGKSRLWLLFAHCGEGPGRTSDWSLPYAPSQSLLPFITPGVATQDRQMVSCKLSRSRPRLTLPVANVGHCESREMKQNGCFGAAKMSRDHESIWPTPQRPYSVLTARSGRSMAGWIILEGPNHAVSAFLSISYRASTELIHSRAWTGSGRRADRGDPRPAIDNRPASGSRCILNASQFTPRASERNVRRSLFISGQR